MGFFRRLDIGAHWVDGIFPYTIDERFFDQPMLELVNQGIAQWNDRTEMTLRERRASDKYWLEITGDRHSSTGGGRSPGPNKVVMSFPLDLRGVLSALGEGMGLVSELRGPGRDELVEIFWDHIVQGGKGAFEVIEHPTFFRSAGVDRPSHDIHSVMHPLETFQALQGKQTLRAKSGDALSGQHLSATDIWTANVIRNQPWVGTYTTECDFGTGGRTWTPYHTLRFDPSGALVLGGDNEIYGTQYGQDAVTWPRSLNTTGADITFDLSANRTPTFRGAITGTEGGPTGWRATGWTGWNG